MWILLLIGGLLVLAKGKQLAESSAQAVQLGTAIVPSSNLTRPRSPAQGAPLSVYGTAIVVPVGGPSLRRPLPVQPANGGGATSTTGTGTGGTGSGTGGTGSGTGTGTGGVGFGGFTQTGSRLSML